MYLVTGGAGFIGSHIVARLLSEGSPVRVLDNLAYGNLANLQGLTGDLDVIEGDIRDAALVARASKGVRAVFHHAAEPSVPRSVDDPAGTYDVNVTGMLNVLIGARDAGCRRVVFASSAAVYGDSPEMPKHEGMLPAPLSPYASSKLAGEGLCQVFGRSYGMDAVSLRYFNVFGPRQDPNSAYAPVIPRFLTALTRGVAPVIYGDGEQSRDFIYVENVVDANIRAARTPGVGGKVFNVASGQSTSLNQMLFGLADLIGVRTQPVYEPGRAGDIKHSLADIRAITSGLGYRVVVPFNEGLRRTAESIQSAGHVNLVAR